MLRLNAVPSAEAIESLIDRTVEAAISCLKNEISSEQRVEIIDGNVFTEEIADNNSAENNDNSEPNSTPDESDQSEAAVLDNIPSGKSKRYRNRESEKRDRFQKAKLQFGLTLTRDTVNPHFEEDVSSWSNSKAFIEPPYSRFRLRAIKHFLCYGTGVREDLLNISSMYCTLDGKNAIAWITMGSEKTIAMLYTGAASLRRPGF